MIAEVLLITETKQDTTYNILSNFAFVLLI